MQEQQYHSQDEQQIINGTFMPNTPAASANHSHPKAKGDMCPIQLYTKLNWKNTSIDWLVDWILI